MVTRHVRDAVHAVAEAQDGVLSRSQARAAGAAASAIAHEVACGRWRAYGVHALAVHPLALGRRARLHVAVWEASSQAALDGATSLAVAGLVNFDDGVHVLTPWPNGGRSWGGAHVHNSRLWNPDDLVVTEGLLRTRNDVAAVRAAMYARSDRAAATVMAMAVQQRLTTGSLLLVQALRVNRHRRRPFVLQVAHDIADGAHSLGELDFLGACRRRGLPEPDLQAVRTGRYGRCYRDAHWPDLGVTVEIEGVHHDAPENAVDDSLRQNELTIGRDAVLRVPLLGWRVQADLYLDQVERCLRAAGWRRTA